MGRSSTWFVTARVYASQPKLRSVLIRLMLCNNDIAVLQDAIEQWENTTETKRLPLKRSAPLYFVRALLSHLHEAFEIIEEISKSDFLRNAVEKCDADTIKAFKMVEDFMNSKESDPLHRLRNRATFHYDKQLSEKVLCEIAENEPERVWSYSMGREALDWHFELGAAVMDRIMVREVYRQRGPRSPERRMKIAETA